MSAVYKCCKLPKTYSSTFEGIPVTLSSENVHPFKCFGVDKDTYLEYPSPIHIDVDLAPTISLLWRNGIRTAFCCQGDSGRGGYISLAHGIISVPVKDKVLYLLKESHLLSPDEVEISFPNTEMESWRFGWEGNVLNDTNKLENG